MEAHWNDIPDGDLVAASRHGDRAAYAVLIRRHTRRVYAVCLGILGDVADSEDIAQETFMRGLTNISTLRESDRFSMWITQIARNLCRDFLKTRRKRSELLDRRSAEGRPHPGDFSALYAALERLPEKHRLPLVLYYLEDKSVQGVAAELDVSEAGAYTRLSRARRELRKLLGEEGGSK
jgi:RNA polymerase sigma factor (sigma-70 family)